MNIRRIQPQDISQVSELIKKVMTEYDCVGEGYSINDPEVEDMYASYNNDRSAFYIIENEDRILGCGGIAPLVNGDEKTCELRKMYFYSELRGLGMGQKLLTICLEEAKNIGYTKCYLETVDRMKKAQKLYTRNGFKALTQAEGNTGHCSCDAYYIKEL